MYRRASYGGFFRLLVRAGNHNKRFKAFIAHDGMFNLESQYLETEEMWFVNWDLGGSFWIKTIKVAQRSLCQLSPPVCPELGYTNTCSAQ